MDEQCKTFALFRYTWPGKDESYICAEHSALLSAVAEAIGLHLQLIELDQVQQCRQRVEKRKT
jgi:hypothetical protein